jgi:RNA recognition motif-containing protein
MAIGSVEIVPVHESDEGSHLHGLFLSIFATSVRYSEFVSVKPQESVVAKKLYVGNLSYTTTENQLRDLFGQVGEIKEVAVIKDRETGKSKGFGFVEMVTDEDAQEAIKRFNGFSLDNRPLTVNEARPREERGGGGGYGGGGGGYGGGRSGGGGGRRDDYGGGGGGRGRRDDFGDSGGGRGRRF